MIDGDAGRLVYRGYDIHDLARNASYEETLHLLWEGDLPDSGDLDAFAARMAVTNLEPVTHFRGRRQATAMPNLALVVAQFYGDVAEEMTADGYERAAARDADVVATVPVPGVYDAPLAADRLARRDDVDAVAVLGAVVAGDTDHDQVVAHTAARQCAAVALDRDTPVTSGVMGPAMSGDEARARTSKAADAADAALDLLEALPAAQAPRTG
jgi:6,7-dimethyl-8-ribityllumazine synthase